MYRGRWSVLEYPGAVGKTKLICDADGMAQDEWKCSVMREAGAELHRGRAAQRADIWGVAVAVIHEKEEGSRKKMAVLDSCICSFSCTGCPGCRQVRFSIREEECAGRGYWCSFASALARRWGRGRPHHRVLCFWFADGSKYLAPLPLRH